jgi:hypothetical protein
MNNNHSVVALELQELLDTQTLSHLSEQEALALLTREFHHQRKPTQFSRRLNTLQLSILVFALGLIIMFLLYHEPVYLTEALLTFCLCFLNILLIWREKRLKSLEMNSRLDEIQAKMGHFKDATNMNFSLPTVSFCFLNT